MKEEIPLSMANRLINHGPVVLVTSERKGQPNVMAAAWQTPVSGEPPLVALSISPERYSHRLIMDSGQLVVNVPPRELVREVYYCGSVSGKDTDKFAETGLIPTVPGKVRPPHIKECIAHLECEVQQSLEVGDHILFIARVVLAVVEKELFDEYWVVDNPRAKSVHHLGGPMFTCPDRRVEVNYYRKVEW